MGRRSNVVAGFVARWLTFAAIYLCFEASDDIVECGYALLFGAAGAALVQSLRARDLASFRAGARTLGIVAWRTLAGAFTETLTLLGPHLVATLARRAPPGRFVRIVFDPGGDDARAAGRRSLVLWAGSLTPNALPLFVARGTIVAHQLVHRRESNAGDLELPI